MNLKDKINAEREYIRNLWKNPTENYKTELMGMKREIISIIENTLYKEREFIQNELLEQKEHFLNLYNYLKELEDTQDIENILKDIENKLNQNKILS